MKVKVVLLYHNVLSVLLDTTNLIKDKSFVLNVLLDQLASQEEVGAVYYGVHQIIIPVLDMNHVALAHKGRFLWSMVLLLALIVVCHPLMFLHQYVRLSVLPVS